jgi:hypothetical protein
VVILDVVETAVFEPTMSAPEPVSFTTAPFSNRPPKIWAVTVPVLPPALG